MEKVGQSESTPKIKLICNDPDASFESFESGACDNGWNYSLQSNMFSDNNTVISRHDSEQCSILNHNKYKTTLKRWLKNNKNNWDGEYGKWKVYRPTEEARQIIQGILHAVYELHTQDFSHGFLNHLENFAIQDKDIVIGGDNKKSKHVILIRKDNAQRGDRLAGVPTIYIAQQADRLAVSNVIFKQILGATNEQWRYPQDLKNLRDQLEETEHVSSKEWKLIVNHPSLWHWRSRFDYPERVWMRFENANFNMYEDMKDGLSNINVLGWGNNPNILDYSSPLQSVYNKNHYRDNALDLLRYLRNVRDHYREHVSRHSHDYIFFNTKLVELKISEISELFLVNLHSMMSKKNIEI